MIENTLVLLKPDAVKRCLIGEIIKRFEQKGLRIAAMKLVWASEALASKHYNKLEKEIGPLAKKRVVGFLTEGPLVALILEGVEAVEVVRSIIGSTEPKTAIPGTIRGDFAHVSLAHANKHDKAIMNLVHASGTKEEAEEEINLWFNSSEVYSYETVGKIYVV